MNPYEVLGVSPSASAEEIRSAYMALVKKYHPDRYQDSDLKKQAEEKMKQINAAYDMLTKKQSGTQSTYGGYGSGSYGSGGSQGSYGQGSGSWGSTGWGGFGTGWGGFGQGSYGSGSYGSGSYGSGSYQRQSTYSGQYASEFSKARNFINAGQIAAAQAVLKSVPLHNAEWNFLWGMCCYRTGEYAKAYEYVSRACQMDSANAEYRSAMNSMRGAGSSQRTWTGRGADLGGCGLCASMLCANLLCNICCRGH